MQTRKDYGLNAFSERVNNQESNLFTPAANKPDTCRLPRLQVKHHYQFDLNSVVRILAERATKGGCQ